MEAGVAPAPQQKKSGALWIVLGCGCAAFLALVAFVGLLVGGVFWATEAPFQAAHDHVNQVQAGDTAGAHAELAATLQAELDEAQFAAFTREWSVLYGNGSEWTVSSRNINNDQATIAGTSVGKDGAEAAVTIHLIWERDAWRVQGIQITPR